MASVMNTSVRRVLLRPAEANIEAASFMPARAFVPPDGYGVLLIAALMAPRSCEREINVEAEERNSTTPTRVAVGLSSNALISSIANCSTSRYALDIEPLLSMARTRSIMMSHCGGGAGGGVGAIPGGYGGDGGGALGYWSVGIIW